MNMIVYTCNIFLSFNGILPWAVQRPIIWYTDVNRRSSEKSHLIYETYKNTVMPHGSHIYATASDMANATMCAYPQCEHSLPHCECVLRCCADCPCITIPEQEITKNMTKQHPQLGFTFITSLDVVLFMVVFQWKSTMNNTTSNDLINVKPN